MGVCARCVARRRMTTVHQRDGWSRDSVDMPMTAGRSHNGEERGVTDSQEHEGRRLMNCIYRPSGGRVVAASIASCSRAIHTVGFGCSHMGLAKLRMCRSTAVCRSHGARVVPIRSTSTRSPPLRSIAATGTDIRAPVSRPPYLVAAVMAGNAHFTTHRYLPTSLTRDHV